MRILFLPLALLAGEGNLPAEGRLSRAVAREIAVRVRDGNEIETVFRPFLRVVEGKRRYVVPGARLEESDLESVVAEDRESDLLVHGVLDPRDPFRLTLEVCQLPGLVPVAEETFKAPRFDGFRVFVAGARLVRRAAGLSPDHPGIEDFPARTMEGYLALLRGREAVVDLDGWHVPDEPEEVFTPFLEALDLEPGMAAAREELSFSAAAAVRSGALAAEPAERAVRRLLEQVPRSREGYTALGRILAFRGRIREAEDALRQALSLDPGRAALRFELGMLLFSDGRLGNAAKLLETVKADPESGADALYALGTIRHLKGDQEGAFELWRESAELAPGNPDLYSDLGRLLIARGQFDEAEVAFEKGLAGKRESPKLHLAFGAYLAEQDRLKPAVEHLTEALRLGGDLPEARVHLGRCQEALGDTTRALHHLRKALRSGGVAAEQARSTLELFTPPEREEKLVENLVSILERPAAEQVVLLKSVLKEEVGFTEARVRLGIALLAEGKPRPGEREFRAVLKKVPEEPEAWSGLASSLRARKKWKAAEEAHREAIRRSPHHAPFHLNFAETLLRMGRIPEAAAEVDHARSLDPANPLIPGFVAGVNLALAKEEAAAGKRKPGRGV